MNPNSLISASSTEHDPWLASKKRKFKNFHERERKGIYIHCCQAKVGRSSWVQNLENTCCRRHKEHYGHDCSSSSPSSSSSSKRKHHCLLCLSVVVAASERNHRRFQVAAAGSFWLLFFLLLLLLYTNSLSLSPLFLIKVCFQKKKKWFLYLSLFFLKMLCPPPLEVRQQQHPFSGTSLTQLS